MSIYVLLVAVGLIGKGFRLEFGDKEGVASLFALGTNPFVGLVLGILATALLQSSSTVTSIIVGLVAGGMPIAVAIPMVMGANVGTTITNTIVSFGHVGRSDEFRKAFAAATVHDFFNVLSIVIFLPLELAFGFLDKLSGELTHVIENIGSVDTGGKGIFKVVNGFGTGLVESLTSWLPDVWAGLVLIILGIALISDLDHVLGKLPLKSVFVGKAQSFPAGGRRQRSDHRYILRHAGFGAGAVRPSTTTQPYRTSGGVGRDPASSGLPVHARRKRRDDHHCASPPQPRSRARPAPLRTRSRSRIFSTIWWVSS